MHVNAIKIMHTQHDGFVLSKKYPFIASYVQLCYRMHHVAGLVTSHTHIQSAHGYRYCGMQKKRKLSNTRTCCIGHGKLLKHTSAKSSKMAMVINLNDRKVFH